MRKEDFFEVLGDIDDGIVEEARMPMNAGASGKAVRAAGWMKRFSMAACFCLILTAAMLMLPGILREPSGVMPSPPGSDTALGVGGDDEQGDEVSSRSSDEPEGTDSRQFSDGQDVIIDLDDVVVNESEGMAFDSALLYRDPELYAEETWGEEEIVAYYGWNLLPGYVPDGLSDGGRGVTAGIVREKATGDIVQEQAGRSFWPDFWDDGSPKSDDDIVIPIGFIVRASKLGILHCALLPVDGSEATDFGGVPVTISHCSLPYGPFDPDRKDASGLYNMPAGYYDVYAGSFALDGVEYEITAQRLELEEVVKIIASALDQAGEPAVTGDRLSVFENSPIGIDDALMREVSASATRAGWNEMDYALLDEYSFTLRGEGLGSIDNVSREERVEYARSFMRDSGLEDLLSGAGIGYELEAGSDDTVPLSFCYLLCDGERTGAYIRFAFEGSKALAECQAFVYASKRIDSLERLPFEEALGQAFCVRSNELVPVNAADYTIRKESITYVNGLPYYSFDGMGINSRSVIKGYALAVDIETSRIKDTLMEMHLAFNLR